MADKSSRRTRAHTHYEILGVSRVASRQEIRSAFRRLIKKYHPDITPGVEGSRFREILNAYRILDNPKTRQAYDRQLRGNEEEGQRSEYASPASCEE